MSDPPTQAERNRIRRLRWRLKRKNTAATRKRRRPRKDKAERMGQQTWDITTPRRCGRPGTVLNERNIAIYRERQSGKTLEAVGKMFNIGKERVRWICYSVERRYRIARKHEELSE